ncbi:hypothetical protein Aple_079280 [Acrocarpospora pleiomorpha]|uniref:HTH cro/C1-type domain-containing protein n=1 Tax=Acrocarpospora pleiomorpha TaxID=90975 RepID=A0A5M3XYI9_9ACTN|nr:XRE family transcriptional regulator [Acrocarpospora pleiomorpha]GES25029.1 hypothetical protein Aple_079280 [Acrocarpospora pleiomorpha]
MLGETVERIQRLIAGSGLNQAAFAAKAGLDASKFSKSMNGVRRFTSLELARIADVGDVTVDWLLGVDKSVPALAARTRESAATSEAQAIAEADRLAQHWSDLASLGYRQPSTVLDAVPQRGLSIDQGHRLAELALARAADRGVEPWRVRDLSTVVEGVFGIDVRIMRFPRGYEGLSWADDNSRLMVVGTSDIPARQRFTIAHELGHLLARDDQGLHLDPDLSDTAHKKKPSEIKANAFATRFLLPQELLEEEAGRITWSDHSFASLACDLWVSPVNLAWRLYNLGLIDRRQCDAFVRMRSLDAAVLTNRLDSYWEWLATAGQPRLPVPLLRTSFQAYRDGKTTLRPFANLLGTETATIRAAMDGAREESPLSP